MLFTIYNTSTGEITKVMDCSPQTILLNCTEDEDYIEGSFDRRIYRVEDGQAIEKE